MTQRDATRSQSATALGDKPARVQEATIQQAFKRGRHLLEPVEADQQQNQLNLPRIVQPEEDRPFESPSTESVITLYESEGTANHSAVTSNHSRYLVSKLDRLHDKKERYQSHQVFLQKCLDENIIPKGLRLELEPSIGNHDEDFLKNWYSKLEEYSRNFMKEVIAFCEKTNIQTDVSISDVNSELQNAVEKAQFDHVQETIIQNNSLRSQDLKRRKNKKFYALKYKKESPRQTTSAWSENKTWADEPAPARSRLVNPGRTYAAVAQTNIPDSDNEPDRPRRTRSRQNNLTYQVRQDHLPLHQQISLQRKRSFRREGNNNNEESRQSEITKLQSRLDYLQGTRPGNRTAHNNQSPPTTTYSSPTSPTTTTTSNRSNYAEDPSEANRVPRRQESPKNLNIAQSSNTGTNHEDIREAFAFVSSAMETLKKFETRFATILNTSTTHMGRL